MRFTLLAVNLPAVLAAIEYSTLYEHLQGVFELSELSLKHFYRYYTRGSDVELPQLTES